MSLLRRGDSGEDVRELQEALDRVGLEVEVDGDFGSRTETAVEDFQRANGLELDGVVGPDTRAALGLTAEDVRSDSIGEDTEDPADELPDAPVAVEDPGGGRIVDKADPPASELVVVVGLGGKRVQLHQLAAGFWSRLVRAARADDLASPLLLPVSGYRSRQRQEELWSRALAKYGSEDVARKWVAKPGGSAHHSGRAVDCWLGTPLGSEHIEEQQATQAWAWLTENVEAFGFYPYPAEPWHWEYNPPAAGA